MKNLSVENIYTRQSAKILTKKNFWRMLGMMLLAGLVTGAISVAGTFLLTTLTAVETEVITSAYSYQYYIDTETVTPAFMVGYVVMLLAIGLIGGGLTLGTMRATIDMARGEEKVPVSRMFSRLKYCLKYLGLSIWMGFKILLWALPGVLVMMAAAVLIVSSAYAEEAAELLAGSEAAYLAISFLPMLLMILIFALVIPAALRYSQAPYVLADEPYTGVFECVRKSKAMMKGHKWQLFKLTIPYLLKMYGWMFLVLFVVIVAIAVAQYVPGEAASIIYIVLVVAAYVFLLWKLLVYALRTQMACCVYYLKRRGEMPAVPPEEEERIVAWQPAEARTVPESVATGDDHIACWNPGGEVKEDKE